jgi:cell wall-associated NlpC family hydrolase
MTDAWVNSYVGIPYVLNGRDRAGVDCWGILCLAFREQRGVELPDQQRDGDSLFEAVDRLTDGLTMVGRANLAVQLERPEPWAIVLAHRHRVAHHAGIVVGSHVLHAERGIGVVCAPMVFFARQHGELSFWRWRDRDGIARAGRQSAATA